jgi:hypothetical protein
MGRPQPTVIQTLRREDLKPICQTLNDATALGSEHLRQLVQRWWDYERDLRKMLADDKGLAQELQDTARVNLIPTVDGAQLELRKESSDQGWADVLKKSYLGRDPHEGQRVAARVTANFHFISLLLNPWRKALGKCNNRHCGRYFVRQRIRDANVMYCSPECRGPAETLRKFHEERDKKLLLAFQYLHELWPDKDWKRKLANKLAVTPTWVTWAVNRGDLLTPEQSEKKREVLILAGPRPVRSLLHKNQEARERHENAKTKKKTVRQHRRDR